MYDHNAPYKQLLRPIICCTYADQGSAGIPATQALTNAATPVVAQYRPSFFCFWYFR